MRRLRKRFWRFAGGVFEALSLFSFRRAAKACGCDGCRPVWDLEFRRQLVNRMLADQFGVATGDRKPADRRPS